MKPTSEYKSLGYENGWPMVHVKGDEWRLIKPEALVKCKAMNHEIHESSTKYGQHHYWCNECKIEWFCDSGD